MTNFMQRQVTGNENWLQVETTQGTEFVPSGQLGLFARNSECKGWTVGKRDWENMLRRNNCDGQRTKLWM